MDNFRKLQLGFCNIIALFLTQILFNNNICASSKQSKIKLLQSIENKRYIAMQITDTATLAKYLHNAVAYYHSNDMLDTKQSLLQIIASKQLVHNKITTSNNSFRVFKNTIIVTGNATYDIIWKDKPMVLNFIYANVYTKQKGKWLLVNRNTVKIQETKERNNNM